jgi:hypothetical protein
MNETAQYSANNWQNKLKQPWMIESYCARGGYTCCTHWIGNIPIGDKRVQNYYFPAGDFDRDNHPLGITKPLVAYTPKNKEEERLTKIWKAPGHEQFSGAIGVQYSNIDGEMASPGWVIQTLLGATAEERVPIVFVMTQNHKKSLRSFQLNFEEPR